MNADEAGRWQVLQECIRRIIKGAQQDGRQVLNVKLPDMILESCRAVNLPIFVNGVSIHRHQEANRLFIVRCKHAAPTEWRTGDHVTPISPDYEYEESDSVVAAWLDKKEHPTYHDDLKRLILTCEYLNIRPNDNFKNAFQEKDMAKLTELFESGETEFMYGLAIQQLVGKIQKLTSITSKLESRIEKLENDMWPVR